MKTPTPPIEPTQVAAQKRRVSFRQHISKTWESLKAEHADPGKLGIAVGVGVFVGCSPLHGFQFLLALGLAWALRLNKIAVLAGLQISAPPLLPLLIFGELELGSLLLHGHHLPLSLSQIRSMPASALLKSLLANFLMGSLVLGLGLGLLLGAVTTYFFKRYRASALRPLPPADPALPIEDPSRP